MSHEVCISSVCVCVCLKSGARSGSAPPVNRAPSVEKGGKEIARVKQAVSGGLLLGGY